MSSIIDKNPLENKSIQDYQQWRARTVFMSRQEMQSRLNNVQDNLTAPVGMTFICVLTRPEDLLQIANRMESVAPLENAGLLKQVFIKEELDSQELEYLIEEGLLQTSQELCVSAQEFDYKQREVIKITDINPFFPEHEKVSVEAVEDYRGDYTLIPNALTQQALDQTYPCMLLVSDHESFDRAGDMSIRHTMLFDLPCNLKATPQEYIEIIPQ